MRIIAGTYGGRRIDTPSNHVTHPMSEKIRGAIFNSIGDVSGLTFFDPFAGTGACSLEALSRGAKQATIIEANTDSFKTILKNIQHLALDSKAVAIRGNCASWSANNPRTLFDIVLADPPYKAKDINLALAFKMSRHCKPDGIFVLSAPPNQNATVSLRARQTPYLQAISQKKYGDATVWFYRNGVNLK